MDEGEMMLCPKRAFGFYEPDAKLMGVPLRLRRIGMTAAIKCHPYVKPAI